jgi:hypothetical protein
VCRSQLSSLGSRVVLLRALIDVIQAMLLLRRLARLKILRPKGPLFGRPLVVRVAVVSDLIGRVDI